MTTRRSCRSHGSRHLMMTRLLIALLCACVGSGFAAAGALAASTAAKIGVVLPLSGSSATAGQAAEHGAQLAVQQANSSRLVPGVTFSVVAKNDTPAAGTPNGATGATQINALIGNGQVAGAVAPFDTATGLGELPAANRAPLATVSPSATDTCLTITAALGCTGSPAELSTVQPTGRTTFFRVVPADALQGAALADVLFNGRGYRRAYVIDDTSSAGAARAMTFIDRWQADGGSVAGHVSVPASTVSYVNLLTTIAAIKPDVVVYTGSEEAAGTTLRRQMLQVPGLLNESFAATSGLHTDAFLQASGVFAGPTFVVAPEPQFGQLSSAANFATAYQARFGAPSTDAARGYDSARALLLAIKSAIAGGAKAPATARSSATAFRKAVIAAVARTTFAGAEGSIAFAPNGDLQQGPIEVDRVGSAVGPVGPVPTWTPAGTLQVTEPAPAATLTPSALDFGLTPTQSSSQLTLQLANTGIVPFGVGSVSVTGAGFALAGTTCTTANVVSSARCAITIRFAPGAAGTFRGKVTAIDTTGATVQSATLSGTGVKVLALPAAVYLGNAANSSVRSFTLPLGPDQSPATTLAGADTGLNGTGAVAVDKFGELYVASANSESINMYRGDATGDTRPAAVLAGPDTGIANPTAITLDPQGRLYVANAAAGTVTVYAPGASGDATPIRTITGLTGPSGVVVDAAGNLWVANAPINAVMRFGPSDTKPAATISGGGTQLDGPQSLALDATGDVLVADEYSSAITAYAPTDNGDMPPSYSIAGSSTGLDFPVGLDVDANGNLYVSNFFGNSITVYGAATRDNQAPIETLSGSNTGLAAPEHLAVSPPLAILTRSLPAARVNRGYRTRLIATFGIGRYRWTIRSGRVPAGLRLNARTGLLAGVPRHAGTFRVRIKVSDRAHPADIATRSLTLTIHPSEPRTGRHRRPGGQ
jgi:branched-chain amino acid transport system substrate-binding protein